MSGVAALAPKRVLLVDDDTSILRLMRTVLEEPALVVWVASSLAEARTLLAHRGRPDVVVADIHLPNGDGRHLREELAGVPFIIVSGYAEEEPDFAKPFSMGRLRARVGELLGLEAV